MSPSPGALLIEETQARSAKPARRLPLPTAYWPIGVVGVACFFAIFAQSWIGLSLRDEGFLWYGAQRVLHGELPLRDFQAYDPGRYFWSAAWMALFRDDGILALRAADAILAGITVALATWVVTFDLRRRTGIACLAVGGIFSLWMVPHIKVADSFATILLLFGLTRLIERPTKRRFFQGGVCLGIAAMIGINHALYGSIAGVLVFAYLSGVPRSFRALRWVIAGGMVGYGPMLALGVLSPGAASAFVDGIVRLLEQGTTNLPIPFPDPLAFVRGAERGHVVAATQSLLAILMITIPLLWIAGVWRLRSPAHRASIRPVVPAGLILSVPYAHYMVSRTDVTHAAISVLPVLAVVLAWAVDLTRPVRRWLVIALVLGATILITAGEHPVYDLLKRKPLEPVEIDGATLLVRPNDLVEIRGAQRVAALAGAGSFFAGPYFPGAYALARHKSPVWEIYMLFPSSTPRQQAELAQFRRADVRYALISTERVDGRPDMGLRHTHPLLLAELERHLGYSAKLTESSDMTIRTAARP